MKFTKVIAFVALVCVSTAVSAQDYSRMSDKELSAQYAKDIAQKMADFVNGRLSADLNPSSYAPGLLASPLHFWMPKFVSSRLREAFKIWGKQKHGFLTNEATVIGVETRTSSPVRIIRNAESLQHISIAGLFPCGEGAGYAGGIVSAGVDGERCAEACAAYLRG